MAGKIGMMNEAYFVGKQVLLAWVNNFLDVRMNKVEEMATGALYCQIFDALHPRTVPMARVDFTCKHDYEFMNNWKLLQTAFRKVGIDKPIPVDRLIKAKYQDNLEFFQWVYSYAHEVYAGDADNPDYDARGRRAKSKGGRDFRGPGATGAGGSGSTRRGVSSASSAAHSSSSMSTSSSSMVGAGSGSSSSSASSSALASGARGSRNIGGRSGMRSGGASSASSSAAGGSISSIGGGSGGSSTGITAAQLAAKDEQINGLKRKTDELESFVKVTEERLAQVRAEHADLTAVAKDIEVERDFYFQKVLEVERLCKEWPDQSLALLTTIYNELYKTADDGGFTEGSPPMNTGTGADTDGSSVPAAGIAPSTDTDAVMTDATLIRQRSAE